MWLLNLLLPLLLLFLLDVCDTRRKGRMQATFFLNHSLVPWQRRRCASRVGKAAKGSDQGGIDQGIHEGIHEEPNQTDTNEQNLTINKFEPQDVKINSNLNINIFRTTNDTTSAYDEGICIYNLLKDIEVKDVKRVPAFNPKLANVHLHKEKDYIKLSRGEETGALLDNPLIYKNTNYQLPYILNYYPDDMFIFNFEGVINMNKQEKIVVAFLTFLRLFQRQPKGSSSQGYPCLLFNGKPIEGLPLYTFVRSRNYLFKEGETSSEQPPHNDDPFILLKLIPKFLYSRFLYLYKFLKTTEDLVMAIKYVFDQVDAICTKHNYDINEMLRICEEKNVMRKRLHKVGHYVHDDKKDFKQAHSKQPVEGAPPKENITPANVDQRDERDQRDQLHIYNLVKEFTKGTFNPCVITKYKKIENFTNVFPSFHNDFDNFYKKKMNLKLYERYKVDPTWVRTQFEQTRKLLMQCETDAYNHLMQYRYPCETLSEEERQNHRTFNFCAVDLINHHINVFKKPMYVVSTMEGTDYIEYTLKLFGVNIANEGDSHLLRIFGKDYMQKRKQSVGEGDSNSVMKNLKRLLKSPYFGGRQASLLKNGLQGGAPDDYLYDPYNVDLEYLKYEQKTKKRDYHFLNHRYYLDMLKEKCNLINFVIENHHRGDESIHIIDHKYEDLNAMCNDSRFSQKVRLYLCEWGYNSYADRLKAVHNDRVKSFSQSFKLVFLCCTPQDSPRREHTHGRGLPTDFYTKFMLKYFLKKGLLSGKETDT
ncbi:hypothetical protein AK88_00804 [Plasmodium fragile]|uniref:Uncharacterized protein n=1 Tax=Plasmodium fragile TaxID=5857 RepID=A0A0D9QRP8_PLAFR|nr:uncharacterized protein AK88_00804 [Plasmodium fragile]KJP89593.1 hypothetical protein AK88_00804 [Plasmodium fragile]